MVKATVNKPGAMQPQAYSSGRRASSEYLTARPRKTKEELKKEIELCRDRDAELVSGLFRNYETPGGTLAFKICLYPGDSFDTYELTDGQRYTLPRGVARHLNNGCYYKKYKNVENGAYRDEMYNALHNGQLKTKNMQFAEKVNRFGFSPLDYMVDDDMDILPGRNVLEVTVSP